ncbi:polysaccharide pyruvyl transferase family protein [Pedobacter antarcticus]|uniref:polysaccharide pyruvyl transferase family protein n=1 Tax=Pedobacter antarcticus TaxID=34086 RepID=UPI00088B04CD|nr:polysaccharide pyruvyl transferase family protein [Pedobacter antarcticus]SDL39766.1 Polysaccharide pyruvyl transferase [Pedobacter antarcticus]
MRVINLIYWDSDNFGDALNPLLIEELSGLKVQYKNIQLSLNERIRILFKSIISLRPSVLAPIIFPWQKTFVGVGSVMSWAKADSLIWGAGFMNNSDSFRGGETFAVRGKLTDEKLRSAGFSGSKVYGDPALLLPLWLNPNIKKQHKLGIIPHWKEVDFFIENYGDRYQIIDLRTRDIEKVINEISACEFVLSTSLHGIIVAQAYNVPALWIEKGHIDTDGFKFHDYFSSVNIPFYDGFKDFDCILKNDQTWMQLFEQNRDKANINTSLDEIQSELLRSAPFPLKEKYRMIIQ